MTNAPQSLSDKYRQLDKTYGGGVVSRALQCVSDMPHDDLLSPSRRLELVTIFCQSYEREKAREQTV